MKGKEYQSVDIEDSLSTEDFTSVEQENAEAKFVRLRFFAVISTMCLVVFGVVMYLNSNRESQITQLRSSSSTVSKVMHISDTHIDFFFDPNKSMKSGVCHTCKMSDKQFGFGTSKCPQSIEPESDDRLKQSTLISEGYSFGRYGCNPPEQLWKSLHKAMADIDPNPNVIIFTGDISPHGYPDDERNIKSTTKLEDLCTSKFDVTEKMVVDLKQSFPNTKWAFTMGNNDHFPKDTYWQPYMNKLGEMFRRTGFFTEEQYQMYMNHGGTQYIDVDGIRYLSIDFTLFTAGGVIPPSGGEDAKLTETYGADLRQSVQLFLVDIFAEAEELGLPVYIIGHQPLTTNKGKDELDVEGHAYTALKELFTEYSHIITVGLFGHRNLAGLNEVLSDSFMPLFPSITAPGVSPRGRNQPSFHVIEQDRASKRVMNFEQIVFDLIINNEAAKEKEDPNYMGVWRRHQHRLLSWKTLSGEAEFTTETLARLLAKVPHDQELFFAIESWKKGGYIGDETPESYECKSLYDREEQMMKCLFKSQDSLCWSKSWLN